MVDVCCDGEMAQVICLSLAAKIMLESDVTLAVTCYAGLRYAGWRGVDFSTSAMTRNA